MFGSIQAVKDVSLTIEDGEFFTLLGPSGCGKTTILRIIAGLEKADKGDIYIDNTWVNELDPKDRDVGVVFQSYALYPHMKVFDNLAFPLEARKLSKNLIEKKIRETAKILQIEELLDRKPRQLSGGQQQRVALGRSIVRDAKAFLMDEPLSNLDAKLRVKMRGELKRLQKDLGITTIYVTHYQEEAMTMSDRIAILNRGEIQQVSKPLDAYNHPVNQWVANFIGSPGINTFAAHAKLSAGSTFLILDDLGCLQIPYNTNNLCRELNDGYPVTIGVRPEHMRIIERPVNFAFKGTIYVIEPVGEYTIIELIIGTRTYCVKVSGEPAFNMGDEIMITFDSSKIHIFDRENELNLIRK